MTNRKNGKRVDVYQKITDLILDELDKGTVPWDKSWTGLAPMNIRGSFYRGVNRLILSLATYSSPVWLTYNQAKKLGGHVRKGESATPVVFWKWIKVDDEDPDTGEITTRDIPYLRYYTVFNVDQCDDIPVEKLPDLEKRDNDPIDECEQIVESFPGKPPILHHDKDSAFYRPLTDEVHVPHRENFRDSESYYSTLFHELGHSTGHSSRLDRKSGMDLLHAGHSYSIEELVAEITAAFLCGHAGIEKKVIRNQAAYIDHWRSVIKGDKKLVVYAAARAEKSSEYILGFKVEKGTEDDADNKTDRVAKAA